VKDEHASPGITYVFVALAMRFVAPRRSVARVAAAAFAGR